MSSGTVVERVRLCKYQEFVGTGDVVEHQESYKTITVLKTIEVYLKVDSISLL